VDNGEADLINRNKAIRLRSPRNAEPCRRRRIEENEQRGYSCRPGTGLSDPGARNLFRELQAERGSEAS
jgi:hypothetical protein